MKSIVVAPRAEAVNSEPLRSALARPAPFSLIAVPLSAASLKSPYDRCALLRSSSWVSSPSVVCLHAIGQLLSPAGRCLSISTVHGGAGGGGSEVDDGRDNGIVGGRLDAALAPPSRAKSMFILIRARSLEAGAPSREVDAGFEFGCISWPASAAFIWELYGPAPARGLSREACNCHKTTTRVAAPDCRVDSTECGRGGLK